MNTVKERELRARKFSKNRPRKSTARNIRATALTERKILKGINGASCIVFEMRGPAVRTDLDQTLTALADPTRRAIVELLRERPLRPSEVADVLDISRPAMSRHLRVLRMSRLIEEEMLEDDARSRLLQLRRKPFKQLRDWIDEIESFWADQLEAFKAHAERVPKKRRI